MIGGRPAPLRRAAARRLGVALLAGTALASLPAGAQDGAQTPGATRPLSLEGALTATIVATDNSGLSSGDEEAAIFLVQRGALTLSEVKARTYLAIDADASLQEEFGEGEDEVEFRHSLSALAGLKLMGELLRLEAQGTTREQLENTGGALSLNGVSGEEERVNVQTVRFSPILTPAFSRSLSGRLRYDFVKVWAESDRISEPESHSLSAALRYAPPGSRLDMTLSGMADRTRGDERTADTDTRTAQLQAQWRLNRAFSLLGMAGWEKIDDETRTDDFNSAIGTAGFSWTPSPKLGLTAQAGWRYESTYADASLTWAPTPRTELSAHFTRAFQTGLADLVPIYLRFDPETGGFQPAPPGTEFDAIAFGLVDRSYRFERAGLSLARRFGDMRLSLTARYENRDYEAFPDEEVAGGELSLERAFTRDWRGEATLLYRRTQTEGEDGSNNVYGGRLSASYALGGELNAYAAYSHTRGERVGGRDYDENSISLGVTWRF